MTITNSAEHHRMTEPDMTAIFNAVPAACMVMSPGFTIVAVSDAHLESTGARREQILGRHIFDAFPDNPDQPGADGVSKIRTSIMRVLQSKLPDVMPIQRYDVPINGEPDSGFTVRYWKPMHTPVLNNEGDVAYVIQYVENVTQQVIDLANVAELKSEVSLQARQLRDLRYIADLFQQAPVFMAMLTGPEHRVEFANTNYLKLIGHRDIVGMTVAESLHDAAAQGYVTLLEEVYRTGTPYAANSAKYVVQAAPGGPADERYVDFVFQPIRDFEGKVTGILVQGVDVTDRVLAEARRTALIRMTEVVRDLNTPEDIIFYASVILGETLGVSRVGYGTIDPDAETLTVERDWNAPGVKTLAGTLKLRDYGSHIDDLKRGRFIAISDVATDPRTMEAADALKARHAASFVNVPVIERGDLVALIFVNNAEARNWAPDELALIKEVAERTRIASERLRSEMAMRFSEMKFRTIANAMPQMVWSTLPDGFHDYFNEQWYEFTGLAKGESNGERWINVFHPDDQERTKAVWQHSLATGADYEIEYRLRHFSGEFRWVLGRALPLRDDVGNVIRWMGTYTDIHAQKLAEDEWRQEIRRKDDFLAMLAHELRNPLAPISTAAQLLKLQRTNAKRVEQASEIITRQVKHMTTLVDDLLDVSRVTRGLVQIEQNDVDLRAVINGAIEQAQPLLELRHHELLLRLPSEQTHVRGDKTRLVQAISNLLNNAAKYTPQRGQISLSLEVQQSQVRISIADNGAGIAPELLPKVFDLFTQGERTPDRAQGGLGLGLALVKSITSLHGGTVLAASVGIGKGSTFTIVLPRIVPKATQMAAPFLEPAAHAPANLRLMLVDDNQDAALALGALLETAGHEVLIFEDAQAALDATAVHNIQVFILDIGLPDMDGYELARRLRANAKTANKVLIALTGYGQAHDRVLSKAAGFDHHLVKPVDTTQLSSILASNPNV
jgi:PAS domain S-box-containing protein